MSATDYNNTALPAIGRIATHYQAFTGNNLGTPVASQDPTLPPSKAQLGLLTQAYATAHDWCTTSLTGGSLSALQTLSNQLGSVGGVTFWLEFQKIAQIQNDLGAQIAQLDKAMDWTQISYGNIAGALWKLPLSNLALLYPPLKPLPAGLANNTNTNLSKENLAGVIATGNSVVTAYQLLIRTYPTADVIADLQAASKQITGTAATLTPLPAADGPITADTLKTLIKAWTDLQAVYGTFFSTLQSAQAATKDIPFLAVAPPVTTGSITDQIRDNLFRWNTLQKKYTSFQKEVLPKLIADLETLSARIGILKRDVPPTPATLVSQKDFTAIGDTWRSVQALYATDVNQLNWLEPALQKLSAAISDKIIAIKPPEDESNVSPENVALMLTTSEALQSAYDTILSQLEALYAIPSTANPTITALQKFCLDTKIPLVNPPKSDTLSSISPINVTALSNAWGSMTKIYEAKYNLLNTVWTAIQQAYSLISGDVFPSILLPEMTLSQDTMESNIKALDKACATAQFAYSSIYALYTQVGALISSMPLYNGGEIPSVSEEFNLSNIMSLVKGWVNAKSWHEQYVKNFSSIHPTGKVLDDLQSLQMWVKKAAESKLTQKQIQTCFSTQGRAPGCPTLQG